MSTAIVYYVDGTKNLYRNDVNLFKGLVGNMSPLQLLQSRFRSVATVDSFILLLPASSLSEAVTAQCAELGVTPFAFDEGRVLEKPQHLRQQHWDLEDDSGNDSLLGGPLAELVAAHRLKDVIFIPLTNLLVEPSAVLDSLRLYRREGFDFSMSADRVPGANWFIFNANLILGLQKSHQELMWARGSLGWALHKPLYPFKKGTYNCPRVRPRITADLRLASERAWQAIAAVSGTYNGGLESFANYEFSYEGWLMGSSWEQPYIEYGPKVLFVEPSNHCEASCLGCPHGQMTRDRQHLSLELYTKLTTTFSHKKECRWVFSGMGEPLLNPHFREMLAGLGSCHSMLVTSLQQPFAQGFPFEALNQIRVSVDSCLPGEFATMRPGCSWENIKEFLDFVKEKRRGGEYFPDVGVSLVRNGHTEPIVQTFLNYYKRATRWVGGENFFAWPFDEEQPEVSWYQVLGEADYLGALQKTGSVDFEPVKRRACRGLILGATVLSNGDVTFCPYDFEGRFAVGNLAETGFDELWRGEAYSAVRRRHFELVATGAVMEPCSGCGDWYHYL